ncbi:hypothetical protein GCM10011608_10380 [Micromonospora sonchi]|uniref:Uncharacterized protein n=1 Tax=Micromonospora sonchi TaxID=1763543 RepID=A0A917WTB9_9ACTN|nr:hypothetical protein [Micromonospora sonchi]GGM27511.1 hypothetical protein GCM10011608_10380 [Micromonospora sonchi]
MSDAQFDRSAYDAAYNTIAAYHTLAAHWHIDIADTANRITVAVCELWDTLNSPAGMKQYALDSKVRAPLVIGLLAAVDASEWSQVRPLLDAAVAAAAQALWDGPDAIRYGYPLPADTPEETP